MADVEPEPEKYSIHEMMDRLKQPNDPEPENGVLVTREDGTQAIRVRKRKRRSHQPTKEKAKRHKRIRAVQITAGLSLGVLALLGAGGMLVYANTSAYRTRLLTELHKITGATTEVAQIRVTPTGSTASTLDAAWPESFALKTLALKQVEVDLHAKSFLGSGWSGEEVLAHTAQLQIDTPVGISSPLSATTEEPFFKFQRIRSPKASILIGDSTQPAVAVRDSEISFYPANTGGRAELRLNRGTVSFGKDFPVFAVDRSLLIFNGSQVDLVALRLNAPDHPKSTLQLSGSISVTGESRPATIDVKFAAFPLEQLASRELGRFLKGAAESREATTANFLTFVPGQADSYRFAASWQGGENEPITMTDLPCYSELARLIGDSWFMAPVFDGPCSGVLRSEKNSVRFDELDLHAKSRLRVTGSIALGKDKALSGRLRLGLPPSFVLADETRRLDQLLSLEAEGFRWVDVEISGTAVKPMDDFKQKLTDSLAQPQKHKEAAPQAESRFEELTRPR
jgi:hypothetical protein